MPNAKGRFLAKLGHDGEFNLAFLNVEDCVSRVSLREDCLLLGKGEDLLPVADNRKEFPWVEVALFRRNGVSRAVRHFVQAVQIFQPVKAKPELQVQLPRGERGWPLPPSGA